MLRYVFEAKFCEHAARRVAGGREVSAIVGSRNGALLRERIAPYVARVTLREIAPTLPQERHELVPIAREDVNLDEVAAIADIEDTDIRVAVQALAAAIAGGLVPAPDIERETARLMQMIGGGAALAHLRRAYGLAKLAYVEDIVMARRKSVTLIFNHLPDYRRPPGGAAGRPGRRSRAHPRRHVRRRAARRHRRNSGRRRRGGHPANRRRRLGAQPAARQSHRHARAELDAWSQSASDRPRRAHRSTEPGPYFMAGDPPLH